MVKQKHDRAYYLDRLKHRREDLFRKVMDGTMTLTVARQKAGLGGNRTRLHELKNAWAKASAAERSSFLSHAGLMALPSVTTTPAFISTPSPSTIRTGWSADGRMLTWTKTRVLQIMNRRHISTSQLADELGISRLDVSGINAVNRNERVRSATTAAAVDRWLAKNASV